MKMNKRSLKFIFGFIVAWTLFVNGFYLPEVSFDRSFINMQDTHAVITAEKPSLLVDAYYSPVQQSIRECREKTSANHGWMRNIILFVGILSFLYIILNMVGSRRYEVISATTTFSHRTLLLYVHRVDGKRPKFQYCLNR